MVMLGCSTTIVCFYWHGTTAHGDRVARESLTNKGSQIIFGLCTLTIGWITPTVIGCSDGLLVVGLTVGGSVATSTVDVGNNVCGAAVVEGRLLDDDD